MWRRSPGDAGAPQRIAIRRGRGAVRRREARRAGADRAIAAALVVPALRVADALDAFSVRRVARPRVAGQDALEVAVAAEAEVAPEIAERGVLVAVGELLALGDAPARRALALAVRAAVDVDAALDAAMEGGVAA